MRRRVFGQVRHGLMYLNGLGETATDCWKAIPNHFPNVSLDAWVVMPDHLHGILVIQSHAEAPHASSFHHAPFHPDPLAESADLGVVPSEKGAVPSEKGAACRAPTLGTIVGSFKSAVTKRVNVIRGTPGGRFWQRNYWEYIVRNRRDLERIRTYIRNNPTQW